MSLPAPKREHLRLDLNTREHLKKLAKHNRRAVPDFILQEILRQVRDKPGVPRLRNSVTDYANEVNRVMRKSFEVDGIDSFCDELEKAILI